MASIGWTINRRYLAGNGYAQWAGQLDEIRLSDDALSPSQFLDAGPTNGVPEPAGFILFGSGMLLVAGFLRRKARSS